MATRNQDNNQSGKDIDHLSGVETTGHEWDGLKELNNPAPRWWIWVFILCVIFAIGYWFMYPAWPTLSGHSEGSREWSEYKELKSDQAEIISLRAAKEARLSKASLLEIKNNQELYDFARSGGAIAFKNNCAACHGAGAQGAVGYPNLNDDDWLWGGSLDQLYTTIRYGIRSGHDQAHQSQMPAFLKDGLLKQDEVEAVATYVHDLHLGEKAQKSALFTKGQTLFAANCVSCHGEHGEGNQEVGAPRLNDDIWLYGGDLPTIISVVSNARGGVMPTWEGRLSESTLKELAIYVHSLGGGK